MGLDARQLYERVIVPTLEELGLYSEAAAQLVLGTGLQESRLRLRCQPQFLGSRRLLDFPHWPGRFGHLLQHQ